MITRMLRMFAPDGGAESAGGAAPVEPPATDPTPAPETPPAESETPPAETPPAETPAEETPPVEEPKGLTPEFITEFTELIKMTQGASAAPASAKVPEPTPTPAPAPKPASTQLLPDSFYEEYTPEAFQDAFASRDGYVAFRRKETEVIAGNLLARMAHATDEIMQERMAEMDTRFNAFLQNSASGAFLSEHRDVQGHPNSGTYIAFLAGNARAALAAAGKPCDPWDITAEMNRLHDDVVQRSSRIAAAKQPKKAAGVPGTKGTGQPKPKQEETPGQIYARNVIDMIKRERGPL